MTPLPSCNNGSSLFPKKPTFLRLVKDFWVALKKAVFEKSCEATSFPSLKGKICQKAYNVYLPMVLRLFNTIKERLTICAWDEC